MKLSIITINYNNATGLEKTILSIVNQSYTDFEYIVIDGGSTDGSADIIKKYANKISYWVSEPDKGIYDAMNKGIDAARGQYLLFMNSGDILKSDSLNKISPELDSSEDIIYFNIDIEDKDITYTKKVPDAVDFLFFIKDALPHQAAFIKREHLINYGKYDTKLKIASDWTYFIDAICLLNCSYKHVNDSFSIFFADGISSIEDNRQTSLNERREHIAKNYIHYRSIYEIYDELNEHKETLHKLKMARSIQILKKIGCLKWFQTYSK